MENKTRPTESEIAELDAIFSAIQNPADWREPIAAWIAPAAFAKAAEAVSFYTATALRVVGMRPLDGWLYVEADGYRRGPAGDH